MQTSVQNAKSIRLGSVICRVNGVNIGALANAKFTAEVETLTLSAHNAKLPPSKKVSKVSLSCESWEIDVARLQVLDGLGTVTQLPSETKAVVGEQLSGAGMVAVGTVFTLDKSSSTGSVVTAVTVKNDTTTVQPADYTLFVNPATNKCQIRFTKAVTVAQGKKLTIDYTYQSHTAVQYTVADVNSVIGLYPVEFVNTNKDGKEFVIGLYSAYQANGIEWGFQADDKLDDVMSQSLEFVAFPDGDNLLYYIRDEQGVLA